MWKINAVSHWLKSNTRNCWQNILESYYNTSEYCRISYYIHSGYYITNGYCHIYYIIYIYTIIQWLLPYQWVVAVTYRIQWFSHLRLPFSQKSSIKLNAVLNGGTVVLAFLRPHVQPEEHGFKAVVSKWSDIFIEHIIPLCFRMAGLKRKAIVKCRSLKSQGHYIFIFNIEGTYQSWLDLK